MNTAVGDPQDIVFDQSNTVSTFDRADLRNTCNEIESGVHNAKCDNEVHNIIGDVAISDHDQLNTAEGTGTESFNQQNNFEAQPDRSGRKRL